MMNVIEYVLNNKILATFITAGITGAWLVFINVKEGFHRAKIEFDIEHKILGTTDSDYIVEFHIILKNKGSIKFTFKELLFRVEAIKDTKSLKNRKNCCRLKFPIPLIEENLISQKYKYYFVESGIEQIVSYVAKIPIECAYILTFASFKYRRRWVVRLRPKLKILCEKHTCERSFKLK